MSGSPDIGPMTMPMVTTGCPAHGCCRHRLACYGHQATGRSATDCISGMRVTGDLSSGSTAESTTDTVIPAPASTAAIGGAGTTITTEM